ncbi:hypothetical protein D3C80_1777190 [compost metagenome]
MPAITSEKYIQANKQGVSNNAPNTIPSIHLPLNSLIFPCSYGLAVEIAVALPTPIEIMYITLRKCNDAWYAESSKSPMFFETTEKKKYRKLSPPKHNANGNPLKKKTLYSSAGTA